jgi:uncharacterized damage-inducible protein DinB
MLELAIPIYSFHLKYAQKLVADLPDDQMCAQPVAGRVMNHAAFTLGHLAWASDAAIRYLGSEPQAPAEWKDLVGMGAQPQADRSKYPSKEALLQALEGAHTRLVAALPKLTPEILAQPAPERMRNRFPTVGHLLLGLMTAHEATHLGQLSAWRRALGLPSVF